MTAAGIKWYGAGEIIAWNTWRDPGRLGDLGQQAVARLVGPLRAADERELQLLRRRPGRRRQRQEALDRRLHEGPRPDRRAGEVPDLEQHLARHAGDGLDVDRTPGDDHQVVGQRRPAPGPDRRTQVLPGPDPPRRRLRLARTPSRRRPTRRWSATCSRARSTSSASGPRTRPATTDAGRARSGSGPDPSREASAAALTGSRSGSRRAARPGRPGAG